MRLFRSIVFSPYGFAAFMYALIVVLINLWFWPWALIIDAFVAFLVVMCIIIFRGLWAAKQQQMIQKGWDGSWGYKK